jgi:methylmalonyl-CoA mutase
VQKNVPGEFPLLQVVPFKEKEKIHHVCLQVSEERTGTFSLCKLDCKTFINSFDSVTLYGNDPHIRPDIYGKLVMQVFLSVV